MAGPAGLRPAAGPLIVSCPQVLAVLRVERAADHQFTQGFAAGVRRDVELQPGLPEIVDARR